MPMIDRASECEQFRRLLRRVMEERQGQLLVLEGEAGIGKTKFSRFCREAAAPLQVRVMQGSYRDHAGGVAEVVERWTQDELETWPLVGMVPPPDMRGAGDFGDPRAAFEGGGKSQTSAVSILTPAYPSDEPDQKTQEEDDAPEKRPRRPTWIR